MGKSRVAFGLIPVPLEEASSLEEGTELTELLANHVTDFIQQSSFMDGLSYFFMANLPSEEYKDHSAPWLNMQDHLKRFGNRDKSVHYTTFPVILMEEATHLATLLSYYLQFGTDDELNAPLPVTLEEAQDWLNGNGEEEVPLTHEEMLAELAEQEGI